MLVIKIGDENGQRVELQVDGATGGHTKLLFDGEPVQYVQDVRAAFTVDDINVLGVQLVHRRQVDPDVDFIQYMRKCGWTVRLNKDDGKNVDLLPFQNLGQYPECNERKKPEYKKPPATPAPADKVAKRAGRKAKRQAVTAMQVTTEDKNDVLDAIANLANDKNVEDVKQKADKVEAPIEGEKIQGKIEKQVPDQPGMWFPVLEASGMRVEDKWLDIVASLEKKAFEDGTVFRRSKKTENGWLVVNTIEATGFQK